MFTDPVCIRTGAPCRHCSIGITRTITRTGDIVSGIKRTEEVTIQGEFCNNDGRNYVKDIPVCPVPAALVASLVESEVSELDWMRRRE